MFARSPSPARPSSASSCRAPTPASRSTGYITGQIEGGNVKEGSGVLTMSHQQLSASGMRPAPTDQFTRRLRARATRSATRPAYNLTFDAVSNTAYGPLVAHGEYQFNHGEGFDNTGRGGSDGGLNRAYVTWAGLTAGKIDSFFSFTGGGLALGELLLARPQGLQPARRARLHRFLRRRLLGDHLGGKPGLDRGSGAATARRLGSRPRRAFLGSATRGGMRFPDIVGALDVKQAWGAAHIGGVGHNVRAISTYGFSRRRLASRHVGVMRSTRACRSTFPNMAGSVIGVTGAWSRNAIVYSGLVDGAWGEEGAINGNGQNMATADAFVNNNGTWATPDSVVGHRLGAVHDQPAGYPRRRGLLRRAALDEYRSGRFGALELEELPGRRCRSLRSGQEPRLRIRASLPEHPDRSPGLLLYQRRRPLEWQNSDGFAARFEVTRSF